MILIWSCFELYDAIEVIALTQLSQFFIFETFFFQFQLSLFGLSNFVILIWSCFKLYDAIEAIAFLA